MCRSKDMIAFRFIYLLFMPPFKVFPTKQTETQFLNPFKIPLLSGLGQCRGWSEQQRWQLPELGHERDQAAAVPRQEAQGDHRDWRG